MTTEDDFQLALDANPDDWQTRLVFADWLQERGDERAEGYRALGVMRMYPVMEPHKNKHRRWQWSRWATSVPALNHNYLGEKWNNATLMIGLNRIQGVLTFLTRRLAEDAAARGFNLLSAKDRAKLLTGKGV